MSFAACLTFYQLVELSAAQDVEAGDGTTTVVVLAGALLGAAEKMLQKGAILWHLSSIGNTNFCYQGMHPTIIAESFQAAAKKAVEFLTDIAVPVDLNDYEQVLRAASTSLNSKVSGADQCSIR